MPFSDLLTGQFLSRPALLTISWVRETPPVLRRIWQ
jgi:hypothetical protein